MFLSLKITKQSCRKQTKLAIKNLEVVCAGGSRIKNSLNASRG